MNYRWRGGNMPKINWSKIETGIVLAATALGGSLYASMPPEHAAGVSLIGFGIGVLGNKYVEKQLSAVSAATAPKQ